NSPRPLAFRAQLGVSAGAFFVAMMSLVRIASWWAPDVAPLGWPFRFFHVPTSLVFWWWLVESALEFAAAALLASYGNIGWWWLDRSVFGPCLLRPTDRLMDWTTRTYGGLLRGALARWRMVLGIGGGLIALAAGMLWFDVLGRELTPSEDQSRFVAHVVLPVGSSIDQIDRLLRDCEDRIAERAEVAGMLTTVAGEQGQLMNEADVFVHLVPQHERRLRQK